MKIRLLRSAFNEIRISKRSPVKPPSPRPSDPASAFCPSPRPASIINFFFPLFSADSSFLLSISFALGAALARLFLFVFCLSCTSMKRFAHLYSSYPRPPPPALRSPSHLRPRNCTRCTLVGQTINSRLTLGDRWHGHVRVCLSFFTGISMIDYRPRETCVPSHGVLLPGPDKSLPAACRSAVPPTTGVSQPTHRKRCKQTPRRRLRTRITGQGDWSERGYTPAGEGES